MVAMFLAFLSNRKIKNIKKIQMKKILFFLLMLSFTLQSQNLPKGFSYVKDIVPTILYDLRYCNHNNFVGVPIDGYEINVLITSTATAKALKKVQTELYKKGFSLKVYDAYRPQKAVNHFVRWAKKKADTLTKQEFYPNIKKRFLFKAGYIATKSGHSRGSSVDVTLVNLTTQKELDMGSSYDFFGKQSHINYPKLTQKQKQNRQLLQKVMIANGFKPYTNEWWHFTLRKEPFPKIYFNFPVR